MRIVLDDQQDRIARLDVGPIVRDRLDRALRNDMHADQLRGRQCGADSRVQRHARPDILDRQIEREGRPRAGQAAQVNFAAEQVCQFAADRQSQAGAAVFATGRGVGLLECLEDDLLLLRRNADAGIGDFECDHRRRLAEHRMIAAPAAQCGADIEPDAALRGELEGVRQEVLQDLLQAFGVGEDAASEIRIEMHLERQLARLGLETERPRHRVEHVGEEHILGIDVDRAGLDLRQVENVADEVEQVGAGAVDGLGEFDLLVRKVALRIVGQLLAEDEDRVERRAQLVRHVGQELRLVLRCQRQLGRLLLQGAAGLLDFLVLALDLDVALGKLLRLLLELFVGLLQLLLLRLQHLGELLRLLEQAFGLHRRLDRVEHDADRGGELLEEHGLQGGELVDRGELDHRLDLVLELHRQHENVARLGLEQCRADRHRVVGHVGDQQAAPVERALADQTFTHAQRLRMAGGTVVRVGRQQLEFLLALGFDLVDDALVGVDQRGELGEQEPADRRQVALALQHVGEFRQVRLQPILLGVAVGGEPQVVDHGVDVVFQLGHLAARFDLDRPRQVALGHRGGDLGDGAHLGGQVGGQQVDVTGQILPGAGGAGHVGLAAEPAFDADFARHRGHLIGEGGERVDHVVDGLGKRRDLAFRLHHQVLPQVAGGDRGHYLDDAAHLLGQVGGHDVDGIGEVLPGAGDAGDLRLAAEQSFGADLAGDAGDFRGEGVELIHHGVDGVFQLQNLALHVDRDLARQVAARHGGGHLGDVAHLRGEVRRQQVDVVGEVLPGAGDAGHHGLAAEPAVGADLARHAGHFGGERAQLLDHGVERVLEQQHLAAHVHRDLLRQVAAGDGGRHLGDVAHLRGEVRGHEVDVVGEVLPGAGDAGHAGLTAELALGADLAGDAGHFRSKGVELIHHGVDGFFQLQNFALHVDRDLARQVDVKGEILELKNTINTMVDQLNAFASEVTRVAREVGTEGKLGGQAGVPGVAGTWKDLTDNVNFMASNLTAQVRNIAEVATAIAGGDLSKKITVDVRGEMLLLKDTLNTMVEQLRSFAAEVTRVAREVGADGRLGGQAVVPGVAGTWKDLTDNVNLLAANLTTQVRNIAEVATAVTKGDLTRSIQVEARGEIAELKNYINAMIGNLPETTERNTEQDWLKTNLARFTRMLQGQRDLQTVAKSILSELSQVVAAQHGAFYLAASKEPGETRLRLL